MHVSPDTIPELISGHYAMFSLFRGFWNYLFRKEQVFILIVGLDNAGKTTLLEHVKRMFGPPDYNGVSFEKITPTVGLNLARVTLSGVQVVMWDLGGQESLRTLWDKYFMECHGLVYVVDSSDKDHLESSRAVLGEVLAHEQLKNVPLLVLANKQDKQDALPLTEVEKVFDSGSCSVGDRDYRIHRVSALKGSGVEDCLKWIVERSKENQALQPTKS